MVVVVVISEFHECGTVQPSKKSELGSAQPSSSIAGDKVLNVHYRGSPKVSRTHFLLLRVFFAKMCVFGQFSALAQKIYFLHFFRSDKNIMSLLKQNIQFPPPS